MTAGAQGPHVVSVNVGDVRTVTWRDRQVTTGIWKQPVEGRVPVRGVNLDGDDQADRRVHGGVDKAVYAYASEDYEWWSATTGLLAPGTFGENLTTAGLDLTTSRIGDRWHVGSAVLEVAQPRQPCFKLGIRMGDDGFPGRFAAAGRPGAYLRIVTSGDVGAGDEVTVVIAARPAITVGALTADPIEDEVLQAAAADPRVPEGWRRAAERALAR